jgi:hypothetical protein
MINRYAIIELLKDVPKIIIDQEKDFQSILATLENEKLTLAKLKKLKDKIKQLHEKILLKLQHTMDLCSSQQDNYLKEIHKRRETNLLLVKQIHSLEADDTSLSAKK